MTDLEESPRLATGEMAERPASELPPGTHFLTQAITEYRNRLWWRAKRLTSRFGDVQDDVVQEACKSAFRSGITFRSKEHAYSVLRQHVDWRCKDLWRDPEPDSHIPEDDQGGTPQSPLPSVGSPEEVVLREEALRLLFARLTPAKRAVLTGLLEDIPQQEIAKALGQSDGMITYHKHKIRQEAYELLGIAKRPKD